MTSDARSSTGSATRSRSTATLPARSGTPSSGSWVVTKTAWATSSAILLSALALAAGCGADDDASAAAKYNCRVVAQARAEYALAARWYRAGALGTPAQINAEVRRMRDTPGFAAT